jgi:hypothetical protein
MNQVRQVVAWVGAGTLREATAGKVSETVNNCLNGSY